MHENRSPFELKIKISGEAGDGILTTGDLLMTIMARSGFHSSVFNSFPPNIRGGYSQALITISNAEIISPVSRYDLLFIINHIALKSELPQLLSSKLHYIDSSVFENNASDPDVIELQKSGIEFKTVQISSICKSISKDCAIRSIAILGYLSEILQINTDLVEELIYERFSVKGPQIVEQNLLAFRTSLFYAQKETDRTVLPLQEPLKSDNRIIIDGNHAISLGSLIAEANFFASYPITPATSIGDRLADYLLQNGGFSYQAEDEIAAIGAVIGASFCGRKAFTATSGPGLSLIQEFIGYASMVELPIVVIDVQRAGPSTGMPTKHAQDDLFAAVFGGHGEGQRIIIAPISVQDNLLTTVEAFNFAERYQCPVIILSDAATANIKQTVTCPDLDSIKIVDREVVREWDKSQKFCRYNSDSSINPIPVPGISPITYRVTGIEHDQDSSPSVEPDTRNKQMMRRFDKLKTIEESSQRLLQWDLQSDSFYKADFSIISWGLSASITRKAIINLRKKGYSIAALYPKILFPVMVQSIKRLLAFSKRLFIPESNFSGQYSRIIRMYTDADPLPITICQGDPFTPEYIESVILARLKS